MAIRVLVDSTCDLPTPTIAKHRIGVLPVYLNIEGKSYLDGVDISRKAFYQGLPTYQSQPQTAAPSPARIRAAYEDLARQGAEQILSIHVAGGLSATIDVVRSVAAEFSQAQVTVFDSGNLSLGAGFLAQTAAELAEAGSSMTSIVKRLAEQAERTFTIAALDTMEYLRRSGRVQGLVAGVGELLRFKPILIMHNGGLSLRRVRTWHRAERELHRAIHALAPFDRLGVIHADAAERAARLRAAALDGCALNDVPIVDVTPVIGTHTGPGAVGLAMVSADPISPAVVERFLKGGR